MVYAAKSKGGGRSTKERYAVLGIAGGICVTGVDPAEVVVTAVLTQSCAPHCLMFIENLSSG